MGLIPSLILKHTRAPRIHAYDSAHCIRSGLSESQTTLCPGHLISIESSSLSACYTVVRAETLLVEFAPPLSCNDHPNLDAL